MVDYAIQMAEEGFYVFPLKPNSKRPAIREWQAKATTDLETIKKWWKKDPSRNIGIATEPSNILVVDLDNKNGKSGTDEWDKLVANQEYPDTMIVATPSGGCHLYYQVPDGERLKSSVSLLADGIDTRAAGGFVVAAGSTIDDKSYELVGTHRVCAICPEWLLPKLKQKKPKEREIKKNLALDSPIDIDIVSDYLSTAEPAIMGDGGDHHTYKLCCYLHDHGVSIEKAVTLLATKWNPRCSPPWSLEELHTKMSNAYDFAQSEPGCKSMDIGRVQSAPKTIYNAKDINLDLPLRDWLIEGRLIAGYVTLTIAPGGVGKSMFTMLEALAVASGLPLTGTKPTRCGAVLIYNTEDPQDEIERRLLALAIAHNIDIKTLDNVYYVSGVESPLRFAMNQQNSTIVTKDKQKLEAIIKDHEIVLTVIDPFVRAHGVNENDNGSIDMVVQQMSSLAISTGSAISVVHHTKKISQNTVAGDMDIARGASSLVSAARVVSTILPPSNEEAEALGVPSSETSQLLRLDSAKGNMTPSNQQIRWFRKLDITLPNTDHVGALELMNSETVDDDEALEVLSIIGAYFGVGVIATSMICEELLTLVPQSFEGLSKIGRAEKLMKMFKHGKQGEDYQITTGNFDTTIKGVIHW